MDTGLPTHLLPTIFLIRNSIFGMLRAGVTGGSDTADLMGLTSPCKGNNCFCALWLNFEVCGDAMLPCRHHRGAVLDYVAGLRCQPACTSCVHQGLLQGIRLPREPHHAHRVQADERPCRACGHRHGGREHSHGSARQQKQRTAPDSDPGAASAAHDLHAHRQLPLHGMLV